MLCTLYLVTNTSVFVDNFTCSFSLNRWHLTWKWEVEKGLTFHLPSPEILTRTTSSWTGKRTKIRIPRWRKSTRRKGDMDVVHHLQHGRPCRLEQRTQFISQLAQIGIQLYPQHSSCLKPTKIMLEQNSASLLPQVFFLSHQVTGSLFHWTLLIKISWLFSWRPCLKFRLEVENTTDFNFNVCYVGLSKCNPKYI